MAADNVTQETNDDAGPSDGIAQVDLSLAHHYESSEDMPAHIQKYWHQRYDIFSLYDSGIWLTDDSWFGVTPEPIAHKIATHLAISTPKRINTIIDCFAGAAGNAIAFALSGRWERVFAIERSATVLECAKHNAKLYGVANRIWWIHGDCFEMLNRRLKSVVGEAVVFGSPPWGGPGYVDSPVFGLGGMEPYGIEALWKGLWKGSGFMVLFLPRTSDLNEVARMRDLVWKDEEDREEKRLKVIHYCMWGASKAMCVYLGDFNFDEDLTGTATST